MCEYIPVTNDVENPIGNVKNRSIEFSVPLEYLGTPNPSWKFTIVIGAQDDHGGAGIGEFRSIQKEASEWIGGGKNNTNDSHIYDVMFIN
jgi:carbohydrate-binding DOMON domain-containing protein